MNNEPFVLLSSATKGKFTQLLGTTKLKSPIGRGTCKKKKERGEKKNNNKMLPTGFRERKEWQEPERREEGMKERVETSESLLHLT